jgi:hypothetical protein
MPAETSGLKEGDNVRALLTNVYLVPSRALLTKGIFVTFRIFSHVLVVIATATIYVFKKPETLA